MNKATASQRLWETQSQVAEIDRAAFGELYEYYLPRVFNYMVYRIGDQQLAEDLTATIFEKALTRMASYRRDRGAFSTWLFTIARNVVIDHFRQQDRLEEVNLDALREVTASETPETRYLRQEQFAGLHTCLSALSEREKEIIALKFAAELPNKHIAQIMGLSAENVGVILYRAISKLRKRFEEN